MVKTKFMGKGNKNFRSIIHVTVCILLCLSFIQILPFELNFTEDASATSTWTETSWFKGNYSAIKRAEIIKSSGDLKLLYGQNLYVLDSYNYRIVKTMINGSIWSTYGGWGTGTGQFYIPFGMSYDIKTGFFFIADSYNYRIVKTKFGGTGWTTYGSFGTSGKGQFNRPSDVACDDNAVYVYVPDTYNNRIIKTKMDGTGWTSNGSLGSGSWEFMYPWGICYDDSSGFVFIADMMNHRIVQMKSDGSGWVTYGGTSPGTGKGQFYWPSSINYDNSTEYLYIADRGNHRIVKTMMNGTGWTTYGGPSPGSSKGQFSSPGGIKYDKESGYIYVADSGNSRIVRTKMDGSGWKTYGSTGSGAGQFYYPYDVDLGEKGYCTDGYLASRRFNCRSPAELLTLSWVADTPPGTSVKFQVRTAPDEEGLSSKNFVGPNGSSGNYYTTPGAQLWNGHSGDRWVQYKVYLASNDSSKTPIVRDVTIIYNRLPFKPTIISPEHKIWTNNNKPTFTWQHNDTDSASQTGFQWQVDDNKDFDSIDYNSKNIISSANSYTPTNPIADGIWYWRVRTQDSDDGWGPFSNPYKISIDTESPSSSIIIPINNSFRKKIESISGEASDLGVASGLNRVELAIKRVGDTKYWDGSDWTSIISWLLTSGTTEWIYNSSSVIWTSGESYQIISRAWDNVSNSEIPDDGNIFYFDIDNPTSSIEFPIDNTFYNDLDSISGSSFDTGGAGVRNVDITIIRATDNKYWTGIKWDPEETWVPTTGNTEWNYDTSSIYWENGTQYIISSRATDKINNIEIPTSECRFIYDIAPPTSLIENPIDGLYLNALDIITGKAFDPGGSGVDYVEISLKRGGDNKYWDGSKWNENTIWLSVQGANEWTYDTKNVKWVTDKYYTIVPSATDIAGNKKISWQSNSFMYDDKPPEQSFSIIESADFINFRTVNLSLEFEDSGSGVISMAFSSDNLEWSDWEEVNDTKELTLSEGDGIKTIYFNVKDRADNMGEPIQKNIVLDSTPPECSIIINDDAQFTGSAKVSLSLSATDELSGVNSMALSIDGKIWTPWKPFEDSESVTLSSEDGTQTVYLKVQDNAGNFRVVEDDIILDTTPPHSLSIEINNGAKSTENATVTFTLNALDAYSGVDRMSFSTQLTPWTEWEEFSETKTFTLPTGNGDKVIYFRVTDKLGNTASPVTASIILNEPIHEKGKITTEKSGLIFDFWIILLIIIIIIIVLGSAVAINRKKKKKAAEADKELPAVEAVSVKPTGISPAPTSSYAQVTSSTSTPQLPTATSTVVGPQQTMVTYATAPQQAGQVQPTPQLPPATVQTYMPTPPSTSTIPTQTIVQPPQTPPPSTIQATPQTTTPTPSTSTPAVPQPTTSQTKPQPQNQVPAPTIQEPQQTPTSQTKTPTTQIPGITPDKQKQLINENSNEDDSN